MRVKVCPSGFTHSLSRWSLAGNRVCDHSQIFETQGLDTEMDNPNAVFRVGVFILARVPMNTVFEIVKWIAIGYGALCVLSFAILLLAINHAPRRNDWD